MRFFRAAKAAGHVLLLTSPVVLAAASVVSSEAKMLQDAKNRLRAQGFSSKEEEQLVLAPGGGAVHVKTVVPTGPLDLAEEGDEPSNQMKNG